MSQWEPVEFERDFVLSELHQRGLMPVREAVIHSLCQPPYVAAPGLDDTQRDRMFVSILRAAVRSHPACFEPAKGSLWERKQR